MPAQWTSNTRCVWNATPLRFVAYYERPFVVRYGAKRSSAHSPEGACALSPTV